MLAKGWVKDSGLPLPRLKLQPLGQVPEKPLSSPVPATVPPLRQKTMEGQEAGGSISQVLVLPCLNKGLPDAKSCLRYYFLPKTKTKVLVATGDEYVSNSIFYQGSLRNNIETKYSQAVRFSPSVSNELPVQHSARGEEQPVPSVLLIMTFKSWHLCMSRSRFPKHNATEFIFFS